VKTNVADELELLSCPGDTVFETLEAKKISIVELAFAMDCPTIKLANLIKGKLPLTDDIAAQLEKHLAIDKQFWLNREAIYREKLKSLNSSANQKRAQVSNKIKSQRKAVASSIVREMTNWCVTNNCKAVPLYVFESIAGIVARELVHRAKL
jgi:plasmid maintenance system antidote protein VapI